MVAKRETRLLFDGGTLTLRMATLIQRPDNPRTRYSTRARVLGTRARTTIQFNRMSTELTATIRANLCKKLYLSPFLEACDTFHHPHTLPCRSRSSYPSSKSFPSNTMRRGESFECRGDYSLRMSIDEEELRLLKRGLPLLIAVRLDFIVRTLARVSNE